MFSSRSRFLSLVAVVMSAASAVCHAGMQALAAVRDLAVQAFCHVACADWRTPMSWTDLNRQAQASQPNRTDKRHNRGVERRPTVYPAWRMCASV